MSRPVKAQEPSIEDILASIRRSIISDDDAGEPACAEAAPGRTPSLAKAGARKAVAKKAHGTNGQDNADAPARSDIAADHEPDDPARALTHLVLTQNPRTLEDLVCDMLKPMLKAWLDDNLPNMVERLVRAEIERVSRGRG